MTGRRRTILVGLFFALMFVYVGVECYVYASFWSSWGDPGWYVGQGGRIRIASGLSGADTSALIEGDEVVALEGQEFKNRFQYFKTFYHAAPGNSYTITVRRDGRTQELTLQTAPWLPNNSRAKKLMKGVICSPSA